VTRSFTSTVTHSPTRSETSTESVTRTRTATASATPTRSDTPTETLTRTSSATSSASLTLSSTPTQSVTQSPTSTVTLSPSPSPTPTSSASATPTFTATSSPSATASRTLSPSFSPNPSFSASPSVSASPTATPSGTALPPVIASAAVYNSAGEKVADLAQNLGLYFKPASLPPLNGAALPDSGGLAFFSLGSGTLSWSGFNSAGQAVDGGTYQVVLSMVDAFGGHETVTAPVTVLRQAGGLKVEIFSPAGELVRSFSAAAPQGGEAMLLSSRSLVAGEGKLLIQLGGSGGSVLSWDGRGERGQLLNSGVYLVQVSRQLDSKQLVQSETVTLLSGAGGAPKIIAGPSPAKSGAEIHFMVQGAGQSEVEITVHNLAGELVGRAQGPATGFSWRPQALASGIYLARGRLLAPLPAAIPGRIKLAVLR
jgi:hypothetical protein